MTITRSQFLCDGGRINSFTRSTSLAGPNAHLVVAPNNDTLYAEAWLDLRNGPIILTVPRSEDRYYDVQLIDMYTNTFANVGVASPPTAPEKYEIVGPSWSGTPASGVGLLRAPTLDVWVLARTQVLSSMDLADAIGFEDRYGLTPSADRNGNPPGQPPSPQQRCGSGSVARLLTEGTAFFDQLGVAMDSDPPLPDDAAIVRAMATAHIGPGEEPSHLSGSYRAALTIGLQVARHAFASGLGSATSTRRSASDWTRAAVSADFGTNYLDRAYIALYGLGANAPSQETYFRARKDQYDAVLRGRNSYVIHFAPGAFPTVRTHGFWSITMYGANEFLIANPIHRYSISDRTASVDLSPDGSLNIYVSATMPATGDSNWLPAPSGRFILSFRVYLPGHAILSGSWSPPPLVAT